MGPPLEAVGADRGDPVRYRLVQPSDDYWFDAPDDIVATLLATLLGNGVGWQIEDADGERSFLNRFITEAQFEELVGGPVRDVLTSRKDDVAAAALTVEIDPDKRARMGVDPELWHIEMRTSLADYRAAAQELAAHLGGV